MESIKVKSIVKTHTPRVEASKNISSWFKDETIELNFGEYTGRPSANITMHKDYLAKFLENGWTIAAVGSGVESGKWETVETDKRGTSTSSSRRGGSSNSSVSSSTSSSSNTTERSVTKTSSSSQTDGSNSSSSSSENNSSTSTSSSSTGKSSSSSSASSSNKGSSSSSDGSSSSGNSSNSSSDTRSGSSSSNDNSNTSNAENGSSGSTEISTSNSSSNSHDTGNTDSTTEKTSDASYWSAYQRIKLKRRRMQPELVLQSMVTSFTDAYNSGRGVENDRYNEMVSLYAVALSRTEDECNDLISGAMNLTPLFNKLYSAVKSSLSSAESAASSVNGNAVADAENDVRREYAALDAQARSQMITNGTYNTTVFAAVIAGVARNKTTALAKAKAEGLKVASDSIASVASARGTISAGLLSAAQAMSDAADARKMSATEARNAIIKWIVDFAGQREEVYPELQEISTLTERLGFSVGSAGNVL